MYFSKTWWLRMLKTIKKQQISCRGGFFEEIKAISVEKMHQIKTKNDKNTKNNKFSKILSSFCVILENPGVLEFQRQSTRNKLVVGKAFPGNKRSFLIKKTHNLRPKMTITSNVTIFHVFMQLLSNF